MLLLGKPLKAVLSYALQSFCIFCTFVLLNDGVNPEGEAAPKPPVLTPRAGLHFLQGARVGHCHGQFMQYVETHFSMMPSAGLLGGSDGYALVLTPRERLH